MKLLISILVLIVSLTLASTHAYANGYRGHCWFRFGAVPTVREWHQAFVDAGAGRCRGYVGRPGVLMSPVRLHGVRHARQQRAEAGAWDIIG